jgi:hypothetical protein
MISLIAKSDQIVERAFSRLPTATRTRNGQKSRESFTIKVKNRGNLSPSR